MEKKNMVLLTVIAIATLLVAVVGATFAYFTATVQDNRTGQAEEKGQANIGSAAAPGNLIIEKNSDIFDSFNDEGVYPGHKELIVLKVTSNQDNTTDTYFNIVYKKTENTFPDDAIEFSIYESKETFTGSTEGNAFKCDKMSDDMGGGNYKFYEKCALDESLEVSLQATTHKLATTPLKMNDATTILNGQYPFVITGEATDKTIYYYIIAEYKDTQTSQNDTSAGKKLSGNITIEMAASNENAIKDDDQHLSKKDGE